MSVKGISSMAIGLLRLISLFILPSSAFAAFGFKLDGTLDKPAISKAYFESDFERIVLPLETWRQGIADNKTREDSIFVFKYLSVIYAANPATKEKSRSFMFMLLTLAPTIEILDMYASDEIELMFRSVKKEFRERNAYQSQYDSLGREKQKPAKAASDTSRPASHGPKWIWWSAGGLGLAAVAVGSYFLLHEENSSPSKKSFEP